MNTISSKLTTLAAALVFNGLIMGATLLIVLRAFANGGSSLTGVEAISNTGNAFRPPESRSRFSP